MTLSFIDEIISKTVSPSMIRHYERGRNSVPRKWQWEKRDACHMKVLEDKF